jgi:3',5'-cyclic AMP phosphodiesterase CpdA
MFDRIVVAHISDVHLGPVTGFTPRHWNAKRLTGYVNWRRNRRHAHQRPVTERMVADIRAQAPDHILVSGDLANLGLASELAGARRWLECVGPPDRVSVVPGNHDIYARMQRGDVGVGRWLDYMRDDDPHTTTSPDNVNFPFVRRIGPLAIIGVNSAIPTRPLIAHGALGARQRARLADILEDLGRRRLFRLVMLHHPPLTGQTDARHGLIDAPELMAILTRHGAELVIHGHLHRAMQAWHPGPARPIPVVGAPSGSLVHPRPHETPAGYHLYEIDDASGPSPRIHVIYRGLDAARQSIIEMARHTLTPSPAPAG